MKLHLVRHPQPELAAGLCYGASDVPVGDTSVAEAQAAVRAALDVSRLPVYTSPLRRCLLLARGLGAKELRVDARLAEMDFGAWEMRPWSDIPRAEVDAWAADLLDYRPGGAESVRSVAQRVADFLAELRAADHPEALLVCHAGTIRLLLAMRDGLPLAQAALQAAQAPHRIGYGELLSMEIPRLGPPTS